jgi:O-antigen ligase
MNKSSAFAKPSLLFGLTAAFWIALFLLGGGSRADIQSLVVLRPLAAVMLAYGLWAVGRDDIQPFSFLWVFIGASTLLVASHLLPLPHSIWSNLPGRELIAETDKIAGLGALWRPLSLGPNETWNALYAMLIPAAAFVLFSRMTSANHHMMIGITLVIGLVSAFIGILQVLGPDNGALYFYRITNGGTAVGLFANRNHHAVFLACLIPMLAVFASGFSGRVASRRVFHGGALAAGATLLLLILISGSRAGLLVAMIGICAVPMLFKPEGKSADERSKGRLPTWVNTRNVALAATAFTVILVAILSSRASSFDRLFGESDDGLRLQIWGPIAKIAWTYFPFGSGLGTFADVYKIHEPAAMLSPEYLNHAHNDLLELLLTAGFPGLFLLLVAIVAWGRQAYGLFFKTSDNSRQIRMARLGAVIILMLATASLVDYPLRTPSLSGLLILAAIWMAAGKKLSRAKVEGRKS